MSTTTRNTFSPNRTPNNRFVPQSKPTFTSEELFNMEQQNQSQPMTEEYYDYENDDTEETMTPTEEEYYEANYELSQEQNFHEDHPQINET